jgi:XTP/dITP diphosphohydrolase
VNGRRVILASANSGKLAELKTLLLPLGFELVPQQTLGIESAPETGATFVDNALLKARHAAAARALPAIADDSGIEVDALGGAPGVHSARYARDGAQDGENTDKLLAALDGVPSNARAARYRCVIAFVRFADDAEPVIAEGAWEGCIAPAPQGSGGFGYDPIFIPEGHTRTAAELSAAEKNLLSHRAAALRALVEQLRATSFGAGAAS